MNRASSSWTGRAPRSCKEAFGPYTDYRIEDNDRPRYAGVAWIVWAIVVWALIGLLMAFGGRVG